MPRVPGRLRLLFVTVIWLILPMLVSAEPSVLPAAPLRMAFGSRCAKSPIPCISCGAETPFGGVCDEFFLGETENVWQGVSGPCDYGVNRRRSCTAADSGNCRAGSESVIPASDRSAFWMCSGWIRIPFGSSASVDGLNVFALKFASVPPTTRPPAIPGPINIMLVMFPRNQPQRRK